MKHTWTIIPTGLVFLAAHPAAFAGSWTGTDEEFFEAAADFIETTDKYALRTVRTSYKRDIKATGVNFGVRTNANHFRENDRKFKGVEVAAHVGKQINHTTHLEAGIGAHRVEQIYGQGKKSETSYYVQGTVKPTKQTEFKLRHEHDIAYRNHSLINNAGEILTEDTTTLEATVKPTNRTRVHARTQYSELSDDNRSTKNKVGAYYAVLPSWPYAEVGIEANHINYKNQDNGYWTPDNYRAISLTGSTSFPVSEKVDLSASASVTRSKENDPSAYNTGGYASVGANFKVAKNKTVSVKAHHISSAQNGSSWTENAITTGFSVRF